MTNTSSADSPNLQNGSIVDTLTGNLLDPANTAVTSSDCAAVLPTGGSCRIVTSRVVLASDPTPLVNTVTVHYNPVGFPNDITDSASDSVVITVTPPPRVPTGVPAGDGAPSDPTGYAAVGIAGAPSDPTGYAAVGIAGAMLIGAGGWLVLRRRRSAAGITK